jgi:hypothetical protein
MTNATCVMQPEKVRVTRTDFRQNQREFLMKAKGSTVLVITGEAEQEEKFVLDSKYFDEIMKRLKASVETLEIAMDKRLLNNILSAATTLDQDVLDGNLLSMGDVFSEE